MFLAMLPSFSMWVSVDKILDPLKISILHDVPAYHTPLWILGCEQHFVYLFTIVHRTSCPQLEDLAGENLEEVLGADLRRAPLHWLLLKMNKILNQEARALVSSFRWDWPAWHCAEFLE